MQRNQSCAPNLCVCVCVCRCVRTRMCACVCVCERERERERTLDQGGGVDENEKAIGDTKILR